MSGGPSDCGPLSLKAGELVGVLYDELLKSYGNSKPETLQHLNILIVRTVFCLYAEDSGLFGRRNAFRSYLSHYSPEDVRNALQSRRRSVFSVPGTGRRSSSTASQDGASGWGSVRPPNSTPSHNAMSVVEAYGFSHCLTEAQIVAELFRRWPAHCSLPLGNDALTLLHLYSFLRYFIVIINYFNLV